MKNYKELLILKNLPCVGKAKVNSELKPIIEEGITEDRLISALISKGFNKSDIVSAIDSAYETMDKSSEYGYDNVITIFDKDYPASLKRLGTKCPLYFYVYGNTKVLDDENTLGIIGTRHPDAFVVSHSPEFIKNAIEKTNAVIVSGLAIGCDTIAHQAAMDNNVPTIAIIPAGYSTIPKAKKAICEKIIAKGGLILSEYEPDIKEQRFMPVERDQIIAALSQKIISLQCGKNSGTMHTIKAAHEMQIPIGCYMPEIKEGDFNGHDEAIKKYAAMAISNDSKLQEFLDKENKQIDFAEQLKFM